MKKQIREEKLQEVYMLRKFGNSGFSTKPTSYYNIEDRAKRHFPMMMEDWSKRLDAFLEFDDREILHNSGKIIEG